MKDWEPEVGRIIRVVSRITGPDSYDIVGDYFKIVSLEYDRYEPDQLCGFKAINESDLGVMFDIGNREGSSASRFTACSYKWRPDPQKERSNKLGDILNI
jgi:hypothetical protein